MARGQGKYNTWLGIIQYNKDLENIIVSFHFITKFSHFNTKSALQDCPRKYKTSVFRSL